MDDDLNDGETFDDYVRLTLVLASLPVSLGSLETRSTLRRVR